MSMPEDRLSLIMQLLKQQPDTNALKDRIRGDSSSAAWDTVDEGFNPTPGGKAKLDHDNSQLAEHSGQLDRARSLTHAFLLGKASAPPAADATAVGVPKPPVDTVGVSNRALQSKGALDSIENVPHRSLPVTKNDFGWWDRFEKLLDQNNAQNDTLRQARSGAIPAVPSRNTGKNPVRE